MERAARFEIVEQTRDASVGVSTVGFDGFVRPILGGSTDSSGWVLGSRVARMRALDEFPG
jgi:hypothetical protein